MPRVQFTQNLRRHLETPDCSVAGTTVHEALAAVFAENPRLKGYVLDEQGRLRKHVAIFVDGEVLVDRLRLSDAVRDDSELFVMQALSGG